MAIDVMRFGLRRALGGVRLLGTDGGGAAGARREVVRRLAKLPRDTVVLGHGLAVNGRFPAGLV